MSKQTDARDAQFADLWRLAKVAANAAAEQENAKLGPESNRGLNCGFAWLEMPGNIAFARWAKREGIGRTGYPSGVHIWYSNVHDVWQTQSVSVHEAACRAAREVLAKGLGERMISVNSRFD